MNKLIEAERKATQKRPNRQGLLISRMRQDRIEKSEGDEQGRNRETCSLQLRQGSAKPQTAKQET